MANSDPPDKESVVQPLEHNLANSQLQRCPTCGVVGIPQRIAIHSCQDTLSHFTLIQTTQSTHELDLPESREMNTARVQQCADVLYTDTAIQATDICTDNPHVDEPILEVISNPHLHSVPPRILSILATYHCRLRGFYTREHPRSWVLEVVFPTPEQSSANTASSPPQGPDK